MPPPASPSSPHVIAGRYTVLRKLGAGTVGTVYLVHEPLREKQVALKLLHSERLSREAVESVRDEFRSIATLRHPQIASAYDFGFTEDHEVPYYTREYVAGAPLPEGPPQGQTPENYLQPLLDLLEALSYLHSHDILHLDIHSGNLIQTKLTHG